MWILEENRSNPREHKKTCVEDRATEQAGLSEGTVPELADAPYQSTPLASKAQKTPTMVKSRVLQYK